MPIKKKKTVVDSIIIVFKSGKKVQIECSKHYILLFRQHLMDSSLDFVEISNYCFNKYEIAYVIYNDF